ncbi:MAG: hypothetical protein FJ128_03770 [Deltaproteobacteria bacterium]|nr:hypothetical protein [Deltaproteobacteria bacterium]
MKSFERRLRKLESARVCGVAIVFLKPGESKDEAIARHMAERPQDAQGKLIYIVIWGDPPEDTGIKVNWGEALWGETGEGGRR